MNGLFGFYLCVTLLRLQVDWKTPSSLDSQFHVLDAGYHRDSASPWRRRRRRRQLTGTHHQATTTAAARRARRACSLRRIPIGSREEAGSHSALDMSAVAVEGLRGLFPLEVLGPRLELGAWSCAISVRLLIAGSWSWELELGVPTGSLSSQLDGRLVAWGQGGGGRSPAPAPLLTKGLSSIMRMGSQLAAGRTRPPPVGLVFRSYAPVVRGPRRCGGHVVREGGSPSWLGLYRVSKWPFWLGSFWLGLLACDTLGLSFGPVNLS
jgi:hypothetical protein